MRRQDILKLGRDEFIDSWPFVKGAIFAAIDFIRQHLRIPVPRLLPYGPLLVPLAYFFARNNLVQPSPRQSTLLSQYFWWASLSDRFSRSVESRITQDLKRMDAIVLGNRPSYEGEKVILDPDELQWHKFTTSDAFAKAILCLYAYCEPKSFASNARVNLDNSWLQRTNSKNYHHFFPKSHLHKAGVPDWQANSILNITLVDEHLNKAEIRAKPPSQYMAKFAEENAQLEQTMKSHLIDDLEAYGIWTDNYERFIDERGKRVLAELNKRLYPDLD